MAAAGETAKPLQVQTMSGIRKAAILLVLLGDEAASLVYSKPPHKRICKSSPEEISDLDYISPEISAQILQEYYRLTVTEEYLAQGGADYARTLLVGKLSERTERSSCRTGSELSGELVPPTWTPCKEPIHSNL